MIIDDIDAALDCLTPIGRTVVAEHCDELRRAVYKFAGRHQWTVVRHATCVKWVRDLIAADDRSWLVLDPLFPADQLSDRVQAVRMTRGVAGLGWEAQSAMDAREGRTQGKAVSVLDDAAASGTTLRYVSARVAQTGGKIERFVVYVSTRQARESLRRAFRAAKWMEFMPPDDWMIIHLRDGCPYLPYSGRAAQHQPVLTADGQTVQLRLPATAVEASLWRALELDAAIRQAAVSLKSRVPAKLTEMLQRPATIEDLALLGPSVPALIAPGEVVTGRTTLERPSITG